MKTPEERIVERLDPAVKFDPIIILTVVGTLISIFVNCWRLQHPTADYALAALREEHQRHPKRLLKRMKRRIEQESAEPLTDDQIEAIAQATIAEALDENNAEVFLTTMRETPFQAIAPEGPLDADD